MKAVCTQTLVLAVALAIGSSQHTAIAQVLSGTVVTPVTAGRFPQTRAVEHAAVTATSEDEPIQIFRTATDNNGHFSVDLSIPTVVGEVGATPSVFHLHQNYPNPFNPSTVLPIFAPPTASTASNQSATSSTFLVMR